MIEDWIRKVIPEASFYYQGFDKPFIKDNLTDIRKEDYEQLCIISGTSPRRRLSRAT